jgi:hypothetical protein
MGQARACGGGPNVAATPVVSELIAEPICRCTQMARIYAECCSVRDPPAPTHPSIRTTESLSNSWAARTSLGHAWSCSLVSRNWIRAQLSAEKSRETRWPAVPVRLMMLPARGRPPSDVLPRLQNRRARCAVLERRATLPGWIHSESKERVVRSQTGSCQPVSLMAHREASDSRQPQEPNNVRLCCTPKRRL